MIDRLQAHRRELVLAGRCPGCAEAVPVATLLRDQPCPACATRLDLFTGGGEEVVATLEARIRRQRLGVSLGAGAAAFLSGWLPLLPAFAFLAAYLWLRLGVLNPLSQFLGPHRRLITRWTTRLLLSVLLVALLVLGMALSLVAPLGMLGNGLLVFLKVWAGTALICRYIHWQLRREQQRQRVSPLEWLPIAGGLAALAGTAALGFVAAWWMASHLQGFARHLVG